MKKNFRGFSIIELMVVLGITAVLIAIISAAVIYQIREARDTRARADIKEFVKVAMLARARVGLPLMQITGSSQSNYQCWTWPYDIRNVSEDDPCYVGWINVLDKISAIDPDFAGIKSLKRDPWGSPYLLGEEEDAFSETDCRVDDFRSAGPDGMPNSSDDIWVSIERFAPCIQS